MTKKPKDNYSLTKIFFWTFVFVVVVIFLLNIEHSAENQKQANQLGFKSRQDYAEAQKHNINNPDEWEIYKVKLKEEKEKKRIEHEKFCRTDLQCWGRKATEVAAKECKARIEFSLSYEYKWDFFTGDDIFERLRWEDKEKGVIVLIGKKLRTQNFLGAWRRPTYLCYINPEAKDKNVIKTEVLPRSFF